MYFKTDSCYLNHSEIQINTEHSVRQQKINNNDILKYLVDNLINICLQSRTVNQNMCRVITSKNKELREVQHDTTATNNKDRLFHQF